MSTEPTGPMGVPLAMARDMLCACAAFQAWVGVGDAEAAAAKVDFCVVFDDDGPAALSSNPGAMIDFGTHWNGRGLNYGGSQTYAEQGTVFVYFEKTFEAGTTKAEALITFANELGVVWGEFMAQGGLSGSLNVLEWELVSGPSLEFGSRANTEGLAVNASFLVTHGVR